MQLRCYKELLFCRELRELRMSLSTGLRALVFVLLSRGSLGAISLRPSNAVAELNGQAVFYSEATVFRGAWYFSKTGILNDEINIAVPPCVVNTGYGAHYGTDTTGGTNACNLIVANITMEQAGVYRYAEQDAFSALLTVTDSSPAITANSTTSVVESQSVLIECVLKYNGSIPPAPTLRPFFYWTDSCGQNVSSSYDSTTENTAVSQLTVTAGRQDITPYTCHVNFTLSSFTTTGYSNSTPTVNSNANSPIIKVSYGPSKPEVVKIGSEVITLNGVPCGINILTCSSTGNPSPNYTWYDSADSNTVLSTNDTLTLGEINRNYTCEAQNAIGISSTNYPVAKADCFSTVGCCVYPRNETTSVNVEGCPNNKTQCDCSKGTSGIKLICNATSFPNASYMWSGPGVQPTDSPVYNTVFYNGTYWCTAYFSRSLSNYTGDVSFSNGTSQTTVGECSVSPSTTPSVVSESTTATIATTGSTTACTSGDNCDVAVAAAIAVGAILFISLAFNIMLLIIMVKNMRTKHDPFKRAGTNRTILSPETLDLSNEPPAPATYEELTRSNEIHLQPTYDKLTPKPPAPATYQELTHPDEIHLQPPTYEKLTTKPPSYVDDLS